MSQPPHEPQTNLDPQAQAKADKAYADAYAKASRPWFKKKRFIIPLAIIALFIIGGLMSGGDDAADLSSEPTSAASETTDDSAEEPEEPEAEEPEEPADDTPGIGDAVRDGKFEFVVSGVEDGGTKIGNDFLNETAQGRFHLIHITVTNIGDEAQSMFDSNQEVRDEQGRSFSPNSMAGVYLEDNDVWINEINPGNTVKGTLVFDMPDGAMPAEIDLHDSAFSGGVTVSLR